MDMYQPGDKVRTTCEIPACIAYRSVGPSFRNFAPIEASSRSIPQGTPGLVVQHIIDLIVSFNEPEIEGRAVDPSMVEPIE